MTSQANIAVIAASAPQARRAPRASTVVGLCGLAMVAEGFDTYSMSYAAPLVIRDWGESPASIGVLLAASVVASAMGTMAIGPIADRHGRKPCLLAALVVFGLATLMTAHVSTFVELTAARILSSLALGASVPIAIALASEAVAPARRGVVAATMSGCIALGIVASGLVAAAMVPEHGWPSLMYVGGLFALLLALPVAMLVDEPLRSEGEASAVAGRVSALFAPEFRRATFTALFVMGTIYAVSFFFNFWLPSLLLQHNSDIQEVALANSLAQTMSLIGALFAGRAMDRHGLRALALTFAAAAVVLTLGVGLPGSFGGLVIGSCCICLFMNGAFGGALAVPVHLYPQELRATALGFTIGVSRLVGGSLGPLAGGWLLAWNLPTSAVAIAFGPALLLSAGVLFLYTRRS
jgi:AAHS family 4-hydroxybenzoate transporter-like MFS transporter